MRAKTRIRRLSRRHANSATEITTIRDGGSDDGHFGGLAMEVDDGVLTPPIV